MVASTDRSMFRVMTTRACPIAAMAVIDARVATWLRLLAVRNWGAASVTPAPSTSMTMTRLSSRWRAMAPTSEPRAIVSTRVGANVVSVIRGIRGRRVTVGLERNVAGGGEHHPFLGRAAARDLGGDPALVQDEDPVGHREDLGQVARDEDHGEAGGGKVGD